MALTFTMTGLSPVSLCHPSLGTLNSKELTPLTIDRISFLDPISIAFSAGMLRKRFASGFFRTHI
jgi:hypothetical protein